MKHFTSYTTCHNEENLLTPSQILDGFISIMHCRKQKSVQDEKFVCAFIVCIYIDDQIKSAISPGQPNSKREIILTHAVLNMNELYPLCG